MKRLNDSTDSLLIDGLHHEHKFRLMREWLHFRRNQHLQQRGRVTNASRDGEKCFWDDGMLLRQRVKTVTHVLELLNFVQDRIRDAWVGLPENHKKREIQVG
ncbi:MAG: hypothetical protein WBW38_21790 [Candidatus Sulfotelmatobacter sp.]